ncbi:MAG TPA: choice-of-anchor tandem repeat GloVer-containing protein [Candidatus Acidoferrum sp.]|nr:choice-of-anchor tandem repeat GloVer-containing protein [Candidatus Acidoferrum sp.]
MTTLRASGRAGRWSRAFVLLTITIGIGLLCAGAAWAAPLQVVHGQVPAAVAAHNLQPIERLAATNRLHVAIGLPVRNPDALAQLLQQLYDPGSSKYRQFLSTAQFAESFGPSEQDYQAVITFANTHGLEVAATYPNRLLVDVSGSAVQIEAAFHVKLQVYQHPTENRTFYAPDVEPSLNLSVPVLGISGLNNYALPRPRLHATPIKADQGPATHATGSGPSGTYMGYDFRAAYAPGAPFTGTGQVVGLIEFDGYNAGDITYYETKAGLPLVTVTNVLLTGATGRPSGDGGEVEVCLDIEVAIAMAPNMSKLYVYEGIWDTGPNWHTVLNRMASDNLAKQMSCSWYIPGGPADPVADQIFEEMATQGQSFYNASGDDDAYTGPIDFPGDTPYITQVGGTTLTTSGPGGPWVTEKVWNAGSGTGSGGGVSTSYTIPSYQTNISMVANLGSTTMRNTPDVAMPADNVYVRCDGQDYDVGGTSCAAPLWAGFNALINEAALASGEPYVGFVNPAVYALGKTAALTANFHDITIGNNYSPSSPTKFPAVPGYDLCTGWGTPLGTNLIYSIGVPEALRISPSAAMLFTGPVGGPITPTNNSFTLTNKALGSLDWAVGKDASWLSIAATSGTLTGGGPSTNVTVRPNVQALSLPAGAYTATLWFTNLTDSFVQTRQVTLAIVTPPVITSDPVSQALFQGQTATFTVGTSSNALEYYQWWFDNGVYQTNLTDGGSISGSAAATLTISNVSPANVGAYWVVVTNAAGSATSGEAFLSIVPWRPVITVQPVSQTVLPGAGTSFNVAAVGTQPFSYRWQRNGVNLTDGGSILGSSTSTLTVTNATSATVGTYSVVITNTLGSATSTGAVLALVPVTVPGVSLDTLYSFVGSSVGSVPFAGLVQTTDGNFYGTALAGGSTDDGTVFRLGTNGVVSLVHSFKYSTDGSEPYAMLTLGTNGSLYGGTYDGGSSSYGTIFRMTTNGVTTVLAALNYTSSGGFAVAGLAEAADGNFYGPTLEGGLSGYGTLFRVTPGNAFLTLHSFNGVNASYSSSKFIQGSDGYLYGTSEDGGTNGNWGTVYRATTAGVVTLLASFDYTSGGTPMAGLVQDSDGTFYGTTYYGGTNGAGTVFKMTADGTITSLYSFTGEADGGNPFGGLLLSSDGNLYGTTEAGGTYSAGTLFRITPGGAFVTIANFDGFQGATPECALAQGSDGNLYGTTAYGGQGNEGAIFRVSITAPLQITRQPQTQLVYLGDTATFNVATFGSPPVSYQWRKNGHNLSDGANLAGTSTRTLVLTNVATTDAGNYSVVVSNASGSVTSLSAALQIAISPPYIISEPEDQTVLAGTPAVFSVDVVGDAPLYFQWQKNGTNLTDGGTIAGSSTSTLTINNANTGNAGMYSVIVSNAIDYDVSDGAALTVVPVIQPGAYMSALRAFSSGSSSSGLNPYAGLIQGKDGYLYGTTLHGGSSGYGLAFRMSTAGAYTILHPFANGPDGGEPYAGLVQALDGNLYGATFQGGTNDVGAIFRLSTSGTLKPLYSFFGAEDGSYPAASLIQGADAKLYGMTYQGGTNSYGGIFSITTNGVLTPLYSFDIDTGVYPVGPLIQATNGLLYGCTLEGGLYGSGTVFSLTTNGVFTTLVSFDYFNGGYPECALLQASDGLFYGTTSEGGTNGWGTVFRMTADGTLTTLYSFGYNDGAYPVAGLIQATDGNLYGTTAEGGWGGQGTVFRLTPDGTLTTVVYFDGANGANPESPVVQARDGSFCGTAEYGGPNFNGAVGTGDGLVFRLVLPMFMSNPFTQAVATASAPYTAYLTTDCIRPSGDTLSFSKLSGPAWLNVANDGTLSGTPDVPDIGMNTFTVSLHDNNSWSCTATMYINVVPSPWIKARLAWHGSNLWLTWSGRTPPYQVQMAPGVNGGGWANVGGPVSTNAMVLTPGPGAAYYRIQGQ